MYGIKFKIISHLLLADWLLVSYTISSIANKIYCQANDCQLIPHLKQIINQSNR